MQRFAIEVAGLLQHEDDLHLDLRTLSFHFTFNPPGAPKPRSKAHERRTYRPARPWRWWPGFNLKSLLVRAQRVCTLRCCGNVLPVPDAAGPLPRRSSIVKPDIQKAPASLDQIDRRVARDYGE
jgi:hypothetical protein